MVLTVKRFENWSIVDAVIRRRKKCAKFWGHHVDTMLFSFSIDVIYSRSVSKQTHMMDLSEKSEFILCEIKPLLLDDYSNKNGHITAFRSICDAYQLFGLKVKCQV